MKFFKLARNFRRDEDGAVTVDWVVLTAAIVGLGIAVLASVRTGVTNLGTDIGASLTDASVAPIGTLGTSGTTTTP
ncbi:hypothetical protein LX81_00141 [Palleronia aestuarii]|uniref:Flp pilus assembly pilin Flp n=1 Tax=Palleronia aestuarii TaxID=568105 RepID=A0A2W7NSU1_9RHOB|nr:hypothetical protein [Palleronia aestuarii]PZX19684.1 hypothetical protein LX81_00141 [Palleronia aestuarii]